MECEAWVVSVQPGQLKLEMFRSISSRFCSTAISTAIPRGVETGRGNLLPYVFQGCVLFPLAGEMQSSMCYLYAVCAPIALASLWTFSSEEV